MAHELRLRQTRAMNTGLSASGPDAADIKLNVYVSPSAWQYLIRNGFLMPREGILTSGLIEMECEIASGPPGHWKEIGEDIQSQRNTSQPSQFQANVDPHPVQGPRRPAGHSTPMLETGEIVIRRGAAAVIVAIDTSTHPPHYVVKVLETGQEVNCERHDFLAKGDPRLIDLIAGEPRHGADESTLPGEVNSS